MILHAKDRPGLVAQALDGLVVQIDAVHRDARSQRFRVHRKAVILRRDFDPAGFQILHRLVRAAMAEFQFESFPAKRLPEHLVAETNPKNRNTAVHKRFHLADDVMERRRVAELCLLVFTKMTR